MNEENILIKKAQNGDMNAFRDLVEHYKKIIFYFAYDLTGNHHDAEDLSQEVFIKMFRSLQEFRGEAKLSSWLYRIAVNTWISFTRTGSYKLRASQEPIEEEKLALYNTFSELSGGDPEKSAEASFIQMHIQQALRGLSPRERSVFVLRHYHELRLTEIGEMLNIAEGTVKSILYRAVKKLQKSLEFYRSDSKRENVK